ncbi:hypothetical protein [Iningainema tapete]|nr:hypothetical protein [Iningainema tapete]
MVHQTSNIIDVEYNQPHVVYRDFEQVVIPAISSQLQLRQSLAD